TGAGNIKGSGSFTVLGPGCPRRLFGQATEDEPLDARRFAPVALVGFQYELDARVEAHELVGPGADRRLLEAVVADLLDVLLGHDPARAGRGRTIEGHEIRP